MFVCVCVYIHIGDMYDVCGVSDVCKVCNVFDVCDMCDMCLCVCAHVHVC